MIRDTLIRWLGGYTLTERTIELKFKNDALERQRAEIHKLTKEIDRMAERMVVMAGLIDDERRDRDSWANAATARVVALSKIVAQETPRANATVRRMARIAQAALFT